jgi:hypothetical protein
MSHDETTSEATNADIPTAYSYVRFSSAGQKEGTSVERQVEQGKRWAEANGYVFSEKSFEDLGVSGYSGANLEEESGLGQFLEAVRTGEIEQRGARCSPCRFRQLLPKADACKNSANALNEPLAVTLPCQVRQEEQGEDGDPLTRGPICGSCRAP